MDKKDNLKNRLTPMQYHVTQEKGTEKPYTGEFYKTLDKGKYYCIVCSEELFPYDMSFYYYLNFLNYIVLKVNLLHIADGQHFQNLH